MSYIDESLAESERLFYRARFHWLHKIGAWIALAISLAFALVCLTAIEGSPAWIGALAILAFGLAIFISTMLPLWTTEIGVTSQRLIYKTGVAAPQDG